MRIKEMVADLKKKSDKKSGIDSVYFIACGGSLAGIYAGWYLLERESKKFKVGLYNASEFIQTTPKAFGENSLCICSTLKGTPEVEEAIKFCKENGAYTIAICGEGNEASTKYADGVIRFKSIGDVTTPMLETNVTLSLLLSFELLKQYEDFEYYEEALKAFDVLEEMATKIRKYVNNGPVQQFAKVHRDEDVIYVMGGAPAMGVAYATSICSLMEIQWIHSPTVNSAEFFHGPFETLDRNLPVVHMVSDGRSREEDLRCQRFLEKFGGKVTTIDSKELGIDILGDHVKEYFNHVFLDCAWGEYLTALAIERKHPKEVRRYMWKMEY